MDTPQTFSNSANSLAEAEEAMQPHTIESASDHEKLDTLHNAAPTSDLGSLLENAHDKEPSDDLDERLKEGRRRRAKTFRKVTNLFNKIFGE